MGAKLQSVFFAAKIIGFESLMDARVAYINNQMPPQWQHVTSQN